MTPTTAPAARTGYDRHIPHSTSADERREFRAGPIDHFTVDEVLAKFPDLATWETTRDEMKPYQIDGAIRAIKRRNVELEQTIKILKVAKSFFVWEGDPHNHR